MKKLLRIIGVLCLILLLTAPAWAAGNQSQFRFGGDLFSSGDKLSLEENTSGDLYVSGAELSVNGQTGGDLISAGGQLNLGGTTQGNIRAAGGEIHISGTVDKNVTVAGGTIVIEPDAVIKGNIMAAGGRIAVAGKVQGTALLAGEEVELAGEVGSTRIQANRLQVGPNAVINGDLNYTVSNASISSQAQIKGTTEEKIVKHDKDKDYESNPYIGTIIRAIGGIVLVLLLAYVFPRPTGTAVRSLQNSWGIQLLAGTGFFFLVPVVFVVLAMTVIGLPVALLTLLLYLFAIFFSLLLWLPMAALWLGELVHSRLSGISRLVAAFLMVLALSLVKMVPVLGGIITFVGFLTMMGIIITSIYAASRLAKQPIEV